MSVIDCKEIAQRIKNNVKYRACGKSYEMVVLTNPYDEPSKAYVRNKKLAAEYCDIAFTEIVLDENTTVSDLHSIINMGVPTIVQLPICNKIDEAVYELVRKIMNDSTIDCDGFSEQAYVKPATAKGVMRIREDIEYNLDGKHVCIVGRGQTCAKPLIDMMLENNATVSIAHSHTQNLADITRNCDVIVSCVGKENLITADHVKEGAVVINVGLTRNNEGKLVGDIDFDNVKDKCSYITKNIGGVGLLTVACLMENVVELYERTY